MSSKDNLRALAENKVRFQQDLEFVQALSNPHYLHRACAFLLVKRLGILTIVAFHTDLALNLYFEDDQFLVYLQYLQYWKTSEYAQYIM